MDESTLENWTLPPALDGEAFGYCWTGEERATADDLAALRAWNEARGIDEYDVDERSLVGLHHADYMTTYHERRGTHPEDMPGGKGSPRYARQHCGEGVEFVHGECWYYDDEGRQFGQIPNSGACHRVSDEHGQRLVAGPRPGSHAAELLGPDGVYEWLDDAGFYVVA